MNTTPTYTVSEETAKYVIELGRELVTKLDGIDARTVSADAREAARNICHGLSQAHRGSWRTGAVIIGSNMATPGGQELQAITTTEQRANELAEYREQLAAHATKGEVITE